ncbi:hypothetical protein [Pseudomonas paraeruginosa]|uniref:hypothetical protein n=1 Tax=Pseudomonas paraeruginosa TaxID=2994495 RepID=UPI0039FC279F
MISARIMGYSSSVAEPSGMSGRRCFPAVVGARPDRQQLEAPVRRRKGAARRSYDYRNLSNERHGLNYYKIQSFRLPEN